MRANLVRKDIKVNLFRECHQYFKTESVRLMALAKHASAYLNSGRIMRARRTRLRLTEFKLRSYTPRAPIETNLSNSKISNNSASGVAQKEIAGRLLALDLGEKRVGVAVSDEMRVSVRALSPLYRKNWKELLRSVADLVRRFDAKAVVIGLPLNMDGSEGDAAKEARKSAGKFALSLKLPVYLQDERLTSREAEETLRAAGYSDKRVREQVDSQSAAIILRDFLADHA